MASAAMSRYPVIGPNGLPYVKWEEGRYMACDYDPKSYVLPVAYDYERKQNILANVSAGGIAKALEAERAKERGMSDKTGF